MDSMKFHMKAVPRGDMMAAQEKDTNGRDLR